MSEAPTICRVAAVLFEGFTVLDLYGPVQAFASCRIPTAEGALRFLPSPNKPASCAAEKGHHRWQSTALQRHQAMIFS